MDKEKMSVKAIITSDLPKSEVITNLSKRVYNSELSTPDYSYVLSKIFGKEKVFDGLKDVNYVEYQTTSAGDPFAETTIADFNGTDNKVARETVEAKTQSNVKTRILNSALHNFKANPADAIGAVFTNTINIKKAQELFLEQQRWDLITEGMKTVDVTSAADDIAVNKEIYETILNLETTSKEHEFVGTDGVITVENGDSVQPAKKFNSNEWYVVNTPNFETNTVFDGERSFFNWNGKTLEVAGNITINIEKYEGMSAEAKTALAGMKAMLIHKEAILTVMDWEGAGIANSGKLYSVITNYLKVDSYLRKDKPVILFSTTTAPVVKETKEA